MMDHIFLHHHIFKNAGSTLDFCLSAQFGTGFMHLEADGNPVHEGILSEFLQHHPQLKAISSHNFHAEAFEEALRLRGFRIFNLAMVRRPFQRLISMYKYFGRIPPTHELSHMASQLDLQSFIRLLIDRHPHMIDNPQVNTIANYGFYRCGVSDDDLKKAWARFRTFALCAPVERYDEAMVVLEYFNSPAYLPAGLNMAYVRQNVSKVLPGENDLKKIIGDSNYTWLESLHNLDEHLWNYANAELERRIGLVPNFAARLLDFQERCRRLACHDPFRRVIKESKAAVAIRMAAKVSPLQGAHTSRITGR